ncbi:glycosyltransferase family 4 protein [Flexithrix dorotheae]|uniref:glycosyltransferase family 4 protein n=1 Tax=Flexithrix dorotheae TaxID=70993 RepID=UPI00036CCD89|nr:glycosyltransferase family 4 protein [Flexithrix dorotheae]
MHICFLTHEYPREGYPHGGVGTFIKTLGHALIKNGHNVSIVGMNMNSADEYEIDEGVAIYRLGNNKLKGLNWLIHAKKINRKLDQIHKKDKINIIEASEFGFAFIKKNRDIKYVIRLHGGHHFFAESEKRKINFWKGFQEKRSFKNADKIIGVSNYVMEHTSKYIDFSDKKGKVIYNPANLDSFYPSDILKKVSGRIFFAGTVCEKKGIRQLIQAFPLIKKEVSNAHLLIAGRDWKFPKTGKSYIEFLNDFIDSSVKNCIQFLGPIENNKMPKFIEESEVCVYPSHMEAMPLAWIEVLSMGKALVGSKLGPGSEVVKDDKTGLLCDPFDPEDIAEKVVYLFKNPLKAQELGSNARKDVYERFSIEHLYKENIKFYNSLLA